MTTPLNNSYYVSKSVYIGGGGQNCPKLCPRGLHTPPYGKIELVFDPRVSGAVPYFYGLYFSTGIIHGCKLCLSWSTRRVKAVCLVCSKVTTMWRVNHLLK